MGKNLHDCCKIIGQNSHDCCKIIGQNIHDCCKIIGQTITVTGYWDKTDMTFVRS